MSRSPARPAGEGPRTPRWLALLFVVLCIGAGVRVCLPTWRAAEPAGAFQMFDNCVHALDGVRMADALRAGDVPRFLAEVNARTVWPPLFPIMEAPGFLLFGDGYVVAQRIMIVIAFLSLMAIAAAGWMMGGARGRIAAAWAVAFTASSPFWVGFMTQTMVEGPAVLLFMLSLVFYARWLGYGRRPDVWLACLCGFGLFMLKYNFGVLWGVPLLIHEAWMRWPGPETVRTVSTALGRISWFWRTYAAVVLTACVVLLWLLLQRGWGAEGREHAVAHAAFHGLRWPLLGVMALVALPFALRPAATARVFAGLWRGGSEFDRAFVVGVIVPTGLWFVVPSHAKGLLHFLAGREANMPLWSVDSMLYYPRTFVLEYAPHAWRGVAVLLLALLAVALLRKWRPVPRVIALALAVDFLLLTLHHFKGNRFLFTVVPLIWLAAGWTLAVGVDRVCSGWGRRGRGAVLAASTLLPLATVAVTGADAARVRAFVAELQSPASIERVLDAVADVNVRSHGIVLLGTWNRFPPSLVEWHRRLRHPEARGVTRPVNPLWYETGDPATLVQRMADDPAIERVVVLELREGYAASSPFFAFENEWLVPVHSLLAADPRFVRESKQLFDDSGYVLSIYRRTAQRSVIPPRAGGGGNTT